MDIFLLYIRNFTIFISDFHLQIFYNELKIKSTARNAASKVASKKRQQLK